MRRIVIGVVLGSAMAGLAAAQLAPPVSTYSIVARDPVTGDLGVAVQSHWFSVGTVVTWAEAGVGAVATQSFFEISYGPLGLELMKAGKSAPEALRALTAVDPLAEYRQVAMVDAQGRVAVHTGSLCIAEAGDRTGEQYSVQANLMENDTVWDAMAQAYEATPGDLADRFLAALEAAEREGGDIRGRQSAAIVVVNAEATGKPWVDRKFDLRVEDSPEPIAELRRLLQVARAYEHMNEGDEQVTQGDIDAALVQYRRAEELLPGESEPIFWHAVTLASVGRVDESLPLFAEAYRLRPEWRELVPRLPAARLLPDDPRMLERIVAAGR